MGSYHELLGDSHLRNIIFLFEQIRETDDCNVSQFVFVPNVINFVFKFNVNSVTFAVAPRMGSVD